VQAELDRWEDRTITDDDDFYRQIASRLTEMNAEPDVVAATKNASPAGDRLNEMFASTLAHARDIYEQHASWTAGDVVLKVVPLGNPPLPDPAGFGELGAAACMPTHDALVGEVRLSLAPAQLGPPSWASVPYLLCHELVCHASQSVLPDSADPFTEGWMDFLAKRLHDVWVGDLFPWAPTFATAASDRLAQVGGFLGPNLREPHLTTRAARTLGRVAGQWTEHWLEPFAREKGLDTFVLFQRLSIQLNRVPATSADHKRFIAKVARCVRDPETEIHFGAVARQWVSGKATAEDLLSFR